MSEGVTRRLEKSLRNMYVKENLLNNYMKNGRLKEKESQQFELYVHSKARRM